MAQFFLVVISCLLLLALEWCLMIASVDGSVGNAINDNDGFDVESRLVINVKNDGGQIYQEIIAVNVSEDVVQLEYLAVDGSFMTQLIDFKSVIHF